MTIWGNHSATQYPDVSHLEIDGKPASTRPGQVPGWKRPSSPPCNNAARRSSRPGAPPPRHRRRLRPSITCATGRWAAKTVTGSAWRVPADGSYGIEPGRDLFVPGDLQERQVVHRAGPGHRRFQPQAHGRHGCRTPRGTGQRSPTFCRKRRPARRQLKPGSAGLFLYYFNNLKKAMRTRQRNANQVFPHCTKFGV